MDTLAALLRSGRLTDGRPLKEVRVVFADEAMARRERRPLLDNGVRVRFYDASGALQDLTGE